MIDIVGEGKGKAHPASGTDCGTWQGMDQLGLSVGDHQIDNQEKDQEGHQADDGTKADNQQGHPLKGGNLLLNPQIQAIAEYEENHAGNQHNGKNQGINSGGQAKEDIIPCFIAGIYIIQSFHNRQKALPGGPEGSGGGNGNQGTRGGSGIINLLYNGQDQRMEGTGENLSKNPHYRAFLKGKETHNAKQQHDEGKKGDDGKKGGLGSIGCHMVIPDFLRKESDEAES